MVPEDHIPRFSWRVHGGTVNYEQWVYDGEMPIARFDSSLVEQPEQALRYFNLVPRPLVLRSLRLTPGGMPLVEGVQLYWTLRRSATVSGARAVTTDRLTELRVKRQRSDQLLVRASGRDQGGIATSTTTLQVTYDAKRRGYVYDFQSVLDVASPEEFHAGEELSFEYSDPWFAGLPAPAVAFPGAWKGRYQRFVYEASNGEALQVPLNHFQSSHKSGIRLRENGLFAAVFEPDGNPAFQLVGETARRTVLSVCPWGYDVHLGLSVRPEELSKPVEARFRVFQLPLAAARHMEEGARLPPLEPAEQAFSVVPAYERRCSFSKPCDASQPYVGIDPWPWRPLSGSGHSWDNTEGRSDRFSLRISKEDPGLAEWAVQHEGAGGWMEPWTTRRGARISCFVKTSQVNGPGSYVAARYNVPNEPDVYSLVSSPKIKGTTGWTRLSLELEPAPEEAYFIHVLLRQAGSGTTWFDDLELNYLG